MRVLRRNGDGKMEGGRMAMGGGVLASGGVGGKFEELRIARRATTITERRRIDQIIPREI